MASLPIVPGSNSAAMDQAGYEWGGREAMFAFMLEVNREFATAQVATYARMFREILDLEDTRLLVHCAAGKDRTGFAAALILLALGVDEKTVMEDYLLTSKYFHPDTQMDRIRKKYGMENLEAESILPMLETHEAYLATAFSAMAEDYPSHTAYLEGALGVGPSEREELRARYLE